MHDSYYLIAIGLISKVLHRKTKYANYSNTTVILYLIILLNNLAMGNQSINTGIKKHIR